jgi:uncharacterized CHY-type Zn-finger protein
MEINDYTESQRLFKLLRFTKEDAHSLQTLMNKYVDKHCVVCGKCRGQIRFTLKRYRNWFTLHNITPDEVKEDIHSCIDCGKELTDKRRKRCKDCK